MTIRQNHYLYRRPIVSRAQLYRTRNDIQKRFWDFKNYLNNHENHKALQLLNNLTNEEINTYVKCGHDYLTLPTICAKMNNKVCLDLVIQRGANLNKPNIVDKKPIDIIRYLNNYSRSGSLSGAILSNLGASLL